MEEAHQGMFCKDYINSVATKYFQKYCVMVKTRPALNEAHYYVTFPLKCWLEMKTISYKSVNLHGSWLLFWIL